MYDPIDRTIDRASMFRYLPGLLLVQLVTLALFALNADAAPRELLLRVGLPAVLVALVVALWFRSLAGSDAERDLARTRLEHERERERLQREAEHERANVLRDAERERVEVMRAAERTVRREERRVSRRANLKVGLAFAATGGMGVLFLLSELLTLGLLTLSTGGGALGGYVLRWRQTRAPGGARIDRPLPVPHGGAVRPPEPPVDVGAASVPRLEAPAPPDEPPARPPRRDERTHG